MGRAVYVVGILLLLSVVIGIWKLSRSTIYIFRGSGYLAIGGNDDPIHKTNAAGLRKAVGRLIVGDRYDYLWASHVADQYEGVSAVREPKTISITATFKTHAQADRIVRFRDAMSRFSYPLKEDSQSFNGGGTEAHRETTFEFDLPHDGEKVAAFLQAMLAERETESPVFYLSASFLAPTNVASGIRVEPNEDPLADILGG